ncbi:hypothetical protein KUTeg_015348 [Tegillarca granosa]|uniref:SGNH hydrolase-type esterase domain-containing protein n=1 Tax=Tegillarca granosa TaxID=220873 RepID=A0ABQ9EPW3_TEGGR|nr:hypothetical protein KUTeg_015348 [Tegillarca granosa]
MGSHTSQIPAKQSVMFYSCLPIVRIWPPKLDHVVHFIAYLSLRNLAHSANFLIMKIRYGKAYSLAFFGFLRVGELAVTTGNHTDNIIAVTDIKVNQSPSPSNELFLRYSKTDQLGFGTRILIPAVGGHLCPVKVLQSYLALRPQLKGPLLRHYGGAPLTRYQFVAVLRKSLHKLGIPVMHYKAHSLRIGAATSAAMAVCWALALRCLQVLFAFSCSSHTHDYLSLSETQWVWCVGSSITERAFCAARQRCGGAILCNVTNYFKGFFLLLQIKNPPNFLIVHCGGNDLGRIPLSDLRNLLKQIIQTLAKRLPHTRIIWSQILPRLQWRYSCDPVPWRRKRVNSVIARVSICCGGAYIKYPDITVHSPSLFQSDGVHLSSVGTHCFLNSLQGAIEYFSLSQAYGFGTLLIKRTSRTLMDFTFSVRFGDYSTTENRFFFQKHVEDHLTMSV